LSSRYIELTSYYGEYGMHTGIDDNADRDMEWCGAVVEFTAAGKPNPFTIFCAAYHPQV